ncbi:MAG: BamA/TamA family outer membrane protein, partial [bacterium]|nr:BamA/TamA family outer membrane protein [bacterium]
MNRMFFRILVLGLVACWAAPVPATDGTGYVIERIEVRGNEKTKPEYILRSLPLHTGDRITPDRISASRESLYRTRLFRTVHVASKPGTEQGKAVLVVFVDEKRFGDVGVSFEYTELDGFGYAADAYHVNLWGEGKIVGGEYRQGERLKSFSFSYTDPWLANSGLSAHFKAAASSSDRDLYRSKDPLARGRYDLDRTGGAVGLGQPIGQHYRLVLKYSFEDVQV